MATLDQSLKHFAWLTWQALLGGWGLLMLAASAGLAGYAGKRRPGAWMAIGLPILPLVLPVVATVGWALATTPHRTADWVAHTSLAALVVWAGLAFAAVYTARGVRWEVVASVVLSAVPMLVSTMVAGMSGTGGWI